MFSFSKKSTVSLLDLTFEERIKTILNIDNNNNKLKIEKLCFF